MSASAALTTGRPKRISPDCRGRKREARQPVGSDQSGRSAGLSLGGGDSKPLAARRGTKRRSPRGAWAKEKTDEALGIHQSGRADR